MTMTDIDGHRADTTLEDIAQHFGVSERTVRRWMKCSAEPGGHVREGTDAEASS